MADDIYTIDLLATDGKTITISDDGSGSDWLVFSGSYDTVTNITLQWSVDTGLPTAAAGSYWVGNIGSRLIVNGQIENVRGSAGQDDIIGNDLANILYGDPDSGGERQTVRSNLKWIA